MRDSTGRQLNLHLRRAQAKDEAREARLSAMEKQYNIRLPRWDSIEHKQAVEKQPQSRERGGFRVPRPPAAQGRPVVIYNDNRGRNYL